MFCVNGTTKFVEQHMGFPACHVCCSKQILVGTCDECCRIAKSRGVVPYSSWGSGTFEESNWWDDHGCNEKVGGAAKPNCAGPPGFECVWMHVRASACVRACVRSCVRACFLPVFLCAFVRAGVLACVRASVHPSVRPSIYPSVRPSVRACVRACVRATKRASRRFLCCVLGENADLLLSMLGNCLFISLCHFLLCHFYFKHAIE